METKSTDEKDNNAHKLQDLLDQEELEAGQVS
jgi:hypothetical protein